ncbi:MAG TPA: hypothetical protein VNF73_06490 [Candidatus Saccharimonadales bacterium]|nr:hypothetical protein [Candidatus Saccharimonadales bacterium]
MRDLLRTGDEGGLGLAEYALISRGNQVSTILTGYRVAARVAVSGMSAIRERFPPSWATRPGAGRV